MAINECNISILVRALKEKGVGSLICPTRLSLASYDDTLRRIRLWQDVETGRIAKQR